MDLRILNIVLSVAIGILLAMGAVGGVVYAVTAAPDFNPADQQIIVYGD